MLAKMKCSNCGAEISNLNMSWNWKHLLFVVPIMLIGTFPLLQLTLFKGDVRKDLSISDVTTRFDDEKVEIVGLITNSSGRTWSGVTVKAAFFDSAGKFIDESTEYLSGDIGGNTNEHFKMTVLNYKARLSAPDTKIEVKIAGGRTSPF